MQARKGEWMQRQAVGAHSPEDLATRLEDAFIVRDLGALAELFDERAVLSPRGSAMDLRGAVEIATFAAAHWEANRNYLAQVRRVVQAGDTAAAVVDWTLSGPESSDSADESGRGIDVLRRGSDGGWRYVISLFDVCS
jgi:ketosteroid isomerase-like protein